MLLKEEREKAIKLIQDWGHIAIFMERFCGSDKPPINMLKDKLQECHVVFLIAGHIYGRIVRDLNKNECPIKNTCEKFGIKCESACVVSYTHFEYLYSRHIEKEIYSFKLKDIGDDNSFYEELQKRIGSDPRKHREMIEYYNKGKENNAKFIDGIEFFSPFSNVNEFGSVLDRALGDMKENKKLKNTGLIEAKRLGIADAITINERTNERDIKFGLFNDGIKNSLDVYGIGLIGLSEKSNENGWLETKINEGVNITLCTINPNLFGDSSGTNISSEIGELNKLLATYNFQVSKEYFDLYSKNENYYKAITESHKKLVELIKRLKNKNKAKGEIKLKTIRSFLPLSINIRDKDSDDAAMLVEFWLPLTQKRTIMEVKREVDQVLFDNLVDFYNEILNSADYNQDDEYIPKKGE